MSRDRKEKQLKHKSVKTSPIKFLVYPIVLAGSIVLYVSISVVVGTFIEWSGMFFNLWSFDHSEQVLIEEFAYLGNNFTQDIFGLDTKATALFIIKNLAQSLGENADYINAFFYILMITVVRCTIIILSTLLFVICALAAIGDGLYLRELRKVGGGREHSRVFHRAKTYIKFAIVLSPVIYLAYPGAINPNYVLLPGLLCFFLATLITFSTYKKYI